MDPLAAAAILQLIAILAQNTPAAIQSVADIIAAWKLVDPTGTDFTLLATLADQLRPKDPQGKV